MALLRTIPKVLTGLLAVFLLAGVLSARHGDHALYPATGDTVTVYILNNGFHTDIALPADEVARHGGILAQAGRAANGAPWQVYGWGDLGFYTAKGFNLARAFDGLRALFVPGNPSVIRVFGSDRRPDLAYQGVTAVTLSRTGFEAMAAHIDASFTTMAGAPVAAPVVADEAFFMSPEHFSIARLCNNWTSDQLAAAGLKTAPMFDGLAPVLAIDLRLRDGVK